MKHWHWNACIVKSCIVTETRMGTEKNVSLKNKTQALKLGNALNSAVLGFAADEYSTLAQLWGLAQQQ